MSIEKGSALRKENGSETEKPWVSGAAGARSAEIKSFKEGKVANMEKQYAALVSEIEKLETDLKNGDAHIAMMTPEDPKRTIATLVAGETNRRLGELRTEKEELENSIEEVKNPKKIELTDEVAFE